MNGRFLLAGLVVTVVGAGQVLAAQGNNAFAPIGSSRAGGMITPGSLYKNQSANQGTVRTFNNTPQPGSRAPSTVPQNTTFSQPLYKPASVSTPQQQASFTTTSQTTVLGSPSYTPSYAPLQTTTLAAPFYTPSRPSMSPNAIPAPQQPAYSIAPQFTPVSPAPYAAQPGPYSMPSPSKPIYTMGQQIPANQPALPKAPQTGPFSTTYQSFSMTGPQNEAQMQFQPVPLSSSLTTPLITPLTVPLQQPLSTIPPSPQLPRQTQQPAR